MSKTKPHVFGAACRPDGVRCRGLHREALRDVVVELRVLLYTKTDEEPKALGESVLGQVEAALRVFNAEAEVTVEDASEYIAVEASRCPECGDKDGWHRMGCETGDQRYRKACAARTEM